MGSKTPDVHPSTNLRGWNLKVGALVQIFRFSFFFLKIFEVKHSFIFRGVKTSTSSLLSVAYGENLQLERKTGSTPTRKKLHYILRKYI